MFASKFDTLMNIAKLSNSRMAQAVKLDGTYIGRLRNGARALPKKHPYLPAICIYIAEHITSKPQKEALFRMTGIHADPNSSAEVIGEALEHWLLSAEDDGGAAAGRFISGFTQMVSVPIPFHPSEKTEPVLTQYASFLFGNEGKRRAVEQFFQLILQEKEPQTLLLFSEENMEWMYEDPVFAKRWQALFRKILLKGNRVQIIHTVSRTMNEILEAVMKWVPIYMTGAIEPYYYPRLRDDLFQHTLFIAPKTAAVVSRSVRQNTDGMLNEFITDKEAVAALTTEYERYFSLCSPLMEIFTQNDLEKLRSVLKRVDLTMGNTYIRSAVPPLFLTPEAVVRSFKNETLLKFWEICIKNFKEQIKSHMIYLTLLSPEAVSQKMILPEGDLLGIGPVELTRKQYEMQIKNAVKLSEMFPNLQIRQQDGLSSNSLLYVREGAGVMMAKTDAPVAAFVIHEQNMLYAFNGYAKRDFENSLPFAGGLQRSEE